MHSAFPSNAARLPSRARARPRPVRRSSGRSSRTLGFLRSSRGLVCGRDRGTGMARTRWLRRRDDLRPLVRPFDGGGHAAATAGLRRARGNDRPRSRTRERRHDHAAAGWSPGAPGNRHGDIHRERPRSRRRCFAAAALDTIAVRVAGSWIAAIGLLLLGWTLRHPS